MPHTDAATPDIEALHADPADIADQSRIIDLGSVIEDYPWVRRDEVVAIGGHRFFI